MQAVELMRKPKQLWEGCLLASLAHAIMVAHYPMLSYEHSWDGDTYNVQDGEGRRGAITFLPTICVGAIQDIHSERYGRFPYVEFIKGASEEIKQIAETETFQYLLENRSGQAIPSVTTAFWGEGESLYSLDSEPSLFDSGGRLLEPQFMRYDCALEYWQEYYEMNESQVRLLKRLFERKLRAPKEPLLLSSNDILLIGSTDSEGLSESRVSFQEIDISWEV